MTASSREAGVHADRSESLLPALNVEMCMAQHRSTWAQTNRSLRSTPKSALRITTDKVHYVTRAHHHALEHEQRNAWLSKFAAPTSRAVPNPVNTANPVHPRPMHGFTALRGACAVPVHPLDSCRWPHML